MNAQQNNVAQFMKIFGQTVRERPCIPPDEEANLRIKLIDEEFGELQEALVAKDLVGAADAIADLLYVVYGTACACGFDAQKLLDEVHAANMSKLWGFSDIATLLNRDAQEIYQYNADKSLESDDGLFVATKVSRSQWLVKDRSGKVIKPPNCRKPDIQHILSLG